MKYWVLKDGQRFSEFPTREMAESYADMQRRKIRAGGLFVGNLEKFEDSKKSAAARMKWTVESG